MKRTIAMILSLLLIMSVMIACGGLTPEQEAACKEADEVLQKLCDSELLGELYHCTYTSKTETRDGKLLYIATMTFDEISTGMAKAFGEVVMPEMVDALSKEGIYGVLYLNEGTEEVYRLHDEALDPSILD